MAKIDTLKDQQKTPFLVKCFGQQNIVYIVAFIGVLLLLVGGVFLYLKLNRTKVALESCQSSCSSPALGK